MYSNLDFSLHTQVVMNVHHGIIPNYMYLYLIVNQGTVCPYIYHL